MAYTKTTLISRPAPPDNLGDVWDSIKGGAGSVLDFFGAGLKAQGAADALSAQAAAQAQAQAAAKASKGGVNTTTLLVGGAVLAGVLVFAMRWK